MRGLRFISRFVVPLFWPALLACTAHAQRALPSSICVQQGGALQCKPATAGPWQYRLRDNAPQHYPDEASIYAYLMDSHEPASVFTLMHRWNDTNPFGWPQSRLHGMEISSWKIYRRCVPDPTEFDCDTHPEYLGYQRVRDVTCPPGYGFGSDPNLPYCLPQQDLPPPVRSTTVASVTRR